MHPSNRRLVRRKLLTSEGGRGGEYAIREGIGPRSGSCKPAPQRTKNINQAAASDKNLPGVCRCRRFAGSRSKRCGVLLPMILWRSVNIEAGVLRRLRVKRANGRAGLFALVLRCPRCRRPAPHAFPETISTFHGMPVLPAWRPVWRCAARLGERKLIYRGGSPVFAEILC